MAVASRIGGLGLRRARTFRAPAQTDHTTYALTPRTRVGLTAIARRSRNDAFLYWNSLADPLSVGRLAFGSVRASGASRNVSDAVTFIPQIVHSSARVTLTMDARVTTLGLRPLDANDTPRTLADGTTGTRYGASAQALWQAGGVLWTTGVSGGCQLGSRIGLLLVHVSSSARSRSVRSG